MIIKQAGNKMLEYFSRIPVKITWAMLTMTLYKQDVYMFKIINNTPHL